MLKKRFLLFFFPLLALLAAPVRAEEPDISAQAAILYAPQTGDVLYERDADAQRLIASTTKIMTALVTLEHSDMDETVDIKSGFRGVEGSSMYLKAGERYTVGDLLYGMMLVSGNDAAEVLACHVAGSVEDFAALMNEKAAALGLENTHYVNPHGLDAEEHYSSARDLALLTAAALENETFRTIFSTVSYSAKGVTYTNHNKLLRSYSGCTGGKTGYTDAAGRILVSCAERDGLELICVTISDPDDWADHAALYDAAFADYRYVPALPERLSRIAVESGTSPYAQLRAERQGLLLPRDAEVSTELYLPSFVFAPVYAGERAGEVRVTAEGTETVIPVYYANTVLLDGSIPLTPWERFKRAWYMANRYGVYYPDN